MSEDNADIYNGNSSESKVLFDLLAKNNECSQKAVCKRIVELEKKNKEQETELNELNGEVEKLQHNLQVGQNNIKCLYEENCDLNGTVENLIGSLTLQIQI